MAEQSKNPEDFAAVRKGDVTVAEATPELPRVCLTVDTFRKAREKRLHWVPCPEMGEGAGVYIPTISTAERIAFEAENIRIKKVKRGGSIVEERSANLQNYQERLVVRFAADDDGNRIFAESTEAEAVEWLERCPAPVIGRISDRICELCGYGENDVDDLAGN